LVANCCGRFQVSSKNGFSNGRRGRLISSKNLKISGKMSQKAERLVAFSISAKDAIHGVVITVCKWPFVDSRKVQKIRKNRWRCFKRWGI
jgi:hypothetical protein